MAVPVPTKGSESACSKTAYLWAMLAALCVSLSLLVAKVHFDSLLPQWQLPPEPDYPLQQMHISQLYESAEFLRIAHVLFDPGSTYLLVPFILGGMIAYAAVKFHNTAGLGAALGEIITMFKRFSLCYLGLFCFLYLLGFYETKEEIGIGVAFAVGRLRSVTGFTFVVGICSFIVFLVIPALLFCVRVVSTVLTFAICGPAQLNQRMQPQRGTAPTQSTLLPTKIADRFVVDDNNKREEEQDIKSGIRQCV